MVDLDEELNEVAGHLNAQHARLARIARDLLDQPEQWASEGIWTVERYLCWRTGVSCRSCQATGRHRPALPTSCRRVWQRSNAVSCRWIKRRCWHARCRRGPISRRPISRRCSRCATATLGRQVPVPADPRSGRAPSSDAKPVDGGDETPIGPPVPEGHVAPTDVAAPEPSCGAGCCGHDEPDRSVFVRLR